jgi:plastocyanin
MRRLLFAVPLLLVWLAWPAAAANRQVYIDDNGPGAGKYYLAESRIQQGDTVYWLNRDDTTHTVTFASFDLGSIGPGQEKSHTFNDVGRFSYHCSIHSDMTGALQVDPGTPSPTSATTQATTPRTTVKGGTTATTAKPAPSASSASSSTTVPSGPNDFSLLAPTTTGPTTTTTAAQLAIREDSGNGGTSPLTVALVAIGVVAVMAGIGGYLLYRARGTGTTSATGAK